MAPGLQRNGRWSRYSRRSNSVSHLLWANQVVRGKGALGIGRSLSEGQGSVFIGSWALFLYG